MSVYTFAWDCGRGEIQTLAGMLGPVYFNISEQEVQPFAVMPWGDDNGSEHAALPGIMQRTRGEWPCVPFGAPAPPAGLPDNWTGFSSQPIGSDFHGYSANNEWQLLEKSENSIRLAIEYPGDHAISRLERLVEGVPGLPVLRCQLEVLARSDVTLPIALHPCFKLSDEPEQTEIKADFSFGRVLPIVTEAGVSRLKPDAEFSSLDRVPALGGSLSVKHLPLPFATEEIVQLCGVTAPVTLVNHQAGYKVRINYDQTLFPSVLLWLSNRGRHEYPWLGRFSGVGIEPLCGAFDLGPDIGVWKGNPIAQQGVSTAITLKAGEAIRTEYEFQVGLLS